MNFPRVFYPVRTRGILFHASLLVLLAAASALAVFFAVQQASAGPFVLALLLATALFTPVPVLLYRTYALGRATYVLERDGLRLRWGLRSEDIPLLDVEWVRPAASLPVRLPFPRPSWPGAVTGAVQTIELGRVEFLASGRENLLLIATPEKVFAISPQEPQAFLDAFQEAFELGSLSPIQPRSVLPTAYLGQVWADRPARWVLAAGLALVIGLLVLASLAIQSRPVVALGYAPPGQALEPVPSIQMLLLPILAGLFYLVDLGAGFYFYRHPDYRALAFVLWGSSLITSLLLAAAVLFIMVQP